VRDLLAEIEPSSLSQAAGGTAPFGHRHRHPHGTTVVGALAGRTAAKLIRAARRILTEMLCPGRLRRLAAPFGGP
jgi:hypothetical protein